MDNHSETVLHIIGSITGQNQSVTRQAVKSSMAWAAAGYDFNTVLKQLVKDGYVSAAGTEGLTLTQKGKLEAERIRDKKIQQEFDGLIARCTQSSAYLDFCEELYGYRLYLFNMMDKRQLDDLFDSLNLTPHDKVLDMGCGTGSLLNRIVQTFGCRGTGVDRLSSGLVNRISPLIEYRQTDMDTVLDLNASAALFVDSLYFSRNMGSLLGRLKGSGVKAYMYYSAYLLQKTDGSGLLRENKTQLAQTLNALGLAYKAVDYSENEQMLYKKGIKLLKKYEARFAADGIQDIYERRMSEYEYGAQLYEQGNAARFLYIVEKTE